MDYFILAVIGIVMGLFGGLLGVGGSVIMIPALVFGFGENQHLYQASAMICNFFVGTTATIVHKNAEMLIPSVLKWLIPSAALGVVIGVAISNSSVFAAEKSYLLAHVLGGFMIYVIVHNLYKFRKSAHIADGPHHSKAVHPVPLIILCGLLSGIPAGLLGLGGGLLFIPAQQLVLKIPLKRAISNSAATIASIALIGAFYKNITLSQHNIEILESLKIAAVIIPGAIAGAFVGGRAMHKLPIQVVRAVFILLAALACYKLFIL